MKRLLLAALLVSGLGAQAQQGSNDPTLTLATQMATMFTTWQWESQTLVVDFKDGQPTKTVSVNVMSKSIYATYSINGSIFATINGVAQMPVAYTPMVIGVPLTSTNKGRTVTKTLTELTATHMTLVEVGEDASAKYTQTDTYKR